MENSIFYPQDGALLRAFVLQHTVLGCPKTKCPCTALELWYSFPGLSSPLWIPSSSRSGSDFPHRDSLLQGCSPYPAWALNCYDMLSAYVNAFLIFHRPQASCLYLGQIQTLWPRYLSFPAILPAFWSTSNDFRMNWSRQEREKQKEEEEEQQHIFSL